MDEDWFLGNYVFVYVCYFKFLVFFFRVWFGFWNLEKLQNSPGSKKGKMISWRFPLLRCMDKSRANRLFLENLMVCTQRLNSRAVQYKPCPHQYFLQENGNVVWRALLLGVIIWYALTVIITVASDRLLTFNGCALSRAFHEFPKKWRGASYFHYALWQVLPASYFF